MTDIDVNDQPLENRFLYTEGDAEAQLVYRVDGDGHLFLVHTGVPDELGGRGIAGELVRAAVERAKETGEVVHPWCPYARSWMEKHPDEIGGVSVDWSEPD